MRGELFGSTRLSALLSEGHFFSPHRVFLTPFLPVSLLILPWTLLSPLCLSTGACLSNSSPPARPPLGLGVIPHVSGAGKAHGGGGKS